MNAIEMRNNYLSMSIKNKDKHYLLIKGKKN